MRICFPLWIGANVVWYDCRFLIGWFADFFFSIFLLLSMRRTFHLLTPLINWNARWPHELDYKILFRICSSGLSICLLVSCQLWPFEHMFWVHPSVIVRGDLPSPNKNLSNWVYWLHCGYVPQGLGFTRDECSSLP